MSDEKTVRILVSRDGDMFVAQCLEHDIAVQAPDFETLKARFEATFELEAAEGDIDAIPPAPDDVQERWSHALALRDSAEHTEMRVAA